MFDYPTVKIVFKQKRSNTLNEAPLYLQYIQKRKTNLISLQKKMPIQCWKGDPKEYFYKDDPNRHPMADQVNLYLKKKLLKAKQIILQAQIEEKPIFFETFRQEFSGITKSMAFKDLAEKYINQKIGEGARSLTIISHNSKKNKVVEYSPNLDIHEINEEWISKYEAYLRLQLKNESNTIAKDMQFIRAVCLMAIKDNLIKINPFANYKIKRTSTTPSSLTLEEVKLLRKLYDAKAIRGSLQKSLKRFLWSCYTGMDFQDTNHIQYEHLYKTENQWVLEFTRIKTGVNYLVPLSKEAKTLIKLKKNKNGKIFPQMSNQKTNKYLKEVLSIARIRKQITFHSARHTFGTNSINAGIPREIVKKMMGHSKNDMTDHYARLMPSTIINTSLELWNKQ